MSVSQANVITLLEALDQIEDDSNLIHNIATGYEEPYVEESLDQDEIAKMDEAAVRVKALCLHLLIEFEDKWNWVKGVPE